VAGLCGTIIGLDREYRVKDAGFRTHFLVALGSALMMVVSQYGFGELLAAHGDLRFDPGRIAAQVVSGIGFIGAGTIILHRQLVRGLTTAASLWATAGIGLAAGAHMYVLAGAATVLTLFGLEALTLFFGGLGRKRTLLVYSSAHRAAVEAMFDKLKTSRYTVISYEVEARKIDGEVRYRATLVIRAKGAAEENEFVDLLRATPDITVERIV
jgi:putative Mg2+ transporter-C (MgtC) family protein